MARALARRGFTLVEAAVAIAVVAILAGAMAPMALKVLDQQREAATRASLKLAFEALFGARDRRVANMRSDYGFTVAGDLPTLADMVTRPGATPAMAFHDGSSFQWGWNGPYWHGPVADRAPLDAWGNPIRLECRDQAVQLRSLGRSGRPGPGNLVYPAVPIPLASLRSRLILHVVPSSPDLACQVVIRYGLDRQNGRMGQPAGPAPGEPPTYPVRVPRGGAVVHASVMVDAGTLEVNLEPLPAEGGDLQLEMRGHELFPAVVNPGPGRLPADFRPIPLDLLPGETREVTVNL
jgi:prepilin-type N-terminal cleavage/methylation domain-containing protein